MSGTLPAGLLPPGLSDLFEGLFGASWRGIPFHMPDARHEVGRRVVRMLFPGIDATAHEDLGAFDGGIAVTGIVLGDDYVRRARALEAAFREPGPGTLVHPWLGEIEVVLAKPAGITFTERELRVARFEAVFEPWVERGTAPLDTLGRLLAEADRAKAEARVFLRRVLAPALLPLAAIAAVQGFAADARRVWSGVLAGGRSAGAILSALPVLALPGLDEVGALPVDDGWPDAVTDRLDAVPAGISAAAVPRAAPMVGPAAGAVAPAAAVDARAATELLLAALPGLGRTLPDPAPGPALALASQAQAVAAAVATASGIGFESRQDALAWRARLDTALARLSAAAASAAATTTGTDTATGPGTIWRAVTDLQAAWARDMNERIGRLPPVERLRPPRSVSAWLVAHHLAGDDPARVVAQFEDLVQRNRLRHPAILPPGAALEVLRR